jgi:hypothetical protein
MHALPEDLKQVLTAYYEYWLTIEQPPEERQVCFRWIQPIFRRSFGGTFHNTKLQRLADLGILTLGDTAQGGSRRYYRLADQQAVHDLLTETAASR